jgi:hypothetical protein
MLIRLPSIRGRKCVDTQGLQQVPAGLELFKHLTAREKKHYSVVSVHVNANRNEAVQQGNTPCPVV